MSRWSYLVPVLLLAVASPAIAADPFDGTWKGDIKASQPSKKPDVYMLKDGVFTCSTCVPVLTVASDGAFHPVTGHPYYDEYAVTIVDARTIKRMTRKDGKLTFEGTTALSADGHTATTTFRDLTGANGVPVTGSATDERVENGPPGSHPLSGAWRSTNIADVSDSGLVFAYATTGNTITFTTPTGTSYHAVIDGPDAPVTGDPGWSSVAVKRTGPDTLVETDKRDGKPITTLVMTVSADGKKMTMKVADLRTGRDSTLVAFKQ